MPTLKLFNIYHSFLIKKWYLFVYIVLLFSAVIIAAATISHFSQREDGIEIAVVDRDQTTETKLILSAVQDNDSLSEKISLVKMTGPQAEKELKNRKIAGFISFEKGMTQAFYRNGQLPITVHTYDQTSLSSIVINQLTDSVYSRLMLSEAGILTYGQLHQTATQDELIVMMTELLFTGLDRMAAFDIQEVKTIQTSDYIVVSLYWIALYLFFISLVTLLRMNEDRAMKQRLQSYHFALEKLMIVRHSLALFYTLLFAILSFSTILVATDMPFENYNIPYIIRATGYYLALIYTVHIMSEIIAVRFVKLIIAGAVLLFSGALIPIIYLRHLLGNPIDELFFTQLYHALLELVTANYISDFTPSFYWQIVSVLVVTILLIVWRYRR
ncbi:ABC transporter permease [Kurthia sibirica]|uniref:ABC transporter permease n=1 Tax=Kurthia sibirica TaxID=202750 RepID=A0A2U3AKS1_9BACL|nr:ABC transporter permease [Kurthia sibirica]PWI25156.1 ABC transporter permease [Kurthia sibirica]GEK33242.1 membrane protein [Kurthia sibirica]